MSKNRISDRLRYVTVRILTQNNNTDKWDGSGTGFLYGFDRGTSLVPLLVTNKHVLDGATKIGLHFHVTSDYDNEKPLTGPGRMFSLQPDQVKIIHHPYAEVDLAAICIAQIIEYARTQQGWQPYIRCLTKKNLPSAEMIDEFSALEDIVMVGYPNGIIDNENNFPILRRGITSTPYKFNYSHRPDFLADIPVYGGSSGSPIFVLNEGSYLGSDGIVLGNRFALIGVLYAGHTETVDGKIVAKPIPTNFTPVAQFTNMINLGIAVKSFLIEKFSEQIANF